MKIPLRKILDLEGITNLDLKSKKDLDDAKSRLDFLIEQAKNEDLSPDEETDPETLANIKKWYKEANK